MDKFSKAKRSEIMAAIRGRDTLPEIIVRKWLFAHGYRFRVCDKRIVGHPDGAGHGGVVCGYAATKTNPVNPVNPVGKLCASRASA